MAATLAEPTVLAAAKDTLYPTLHDSANHYAVTETSSFVTSKVVEYYRRNPEHIPTTFATYDESDSAHSMRDVASRTELERIYEEEVENADTYQDEIIALLEAAEGASLADVAEVVGCSVGTLADSLTILQRGQLSVRTGRKLPSQKRCPQRSEIGLLSGMGSVVAVGAQNNSAFIILFRLRLEENQSLRT